MTNFSVLMPVYYKEYVGNLNECLESLASQTLQATEIVIVKDGRLSPELEECLVKWKDTLPLRIVGYEENKGITYALNYGLRFCSFELVARMDSDDICANDRFAKQIAYFEKHENLFLLSGYIKEFIVKPSDIVSIRKVPVENQKIKSYLKKRNAFNHMAVMFKKTAVLSVGGYSEIAGFEDYDLWIKLIHAGYFVDNLEDILVYARIGNNMIGRRTGFRYAKKEITFLYRQKQVHFISGIEFIMLVLCRVPVRLIPSKILSFIYSTFLR